MTNHQDTSTEREALKPCPFCGKTHTAEITTAQELAEQDSDYDGEFWQHSDSFAVICNASRPNGPGGCGASGGFFATKAEAIAAWNRRAALASRDEASQQPQGLPLHIGACIVDGTLHTTVMNRKPDGCVTILATAEMSVDSLMNHDCLAEMQPQGRRATQAQIERARHEYANEDIGIDDDALVSESDDGVWVQGWLWIQNEDADANVEPT